MHISLIAGSAWGMRSPVEVFSETLYADARLQPEACLELPLDVEQRAIYLLGGEVDIGGEQFSAGQLVVLHPGAEVRVWANRASHLMVIGGAPLDGARHLWWNFVSSSRERIERAKQEWRAGRFAPVPGETEFIPLPE